MPIIGRKATFRQPNCSKPAPQPKPEKKKIISKPPKPKKLTLRQKLENIKGVGKKIAGEIIEEYKHEKKLLSAIKKGVFSVGGVNKKKQKLILKKFK